MGYQVGVACYDTQVSAVAAIASAKVGATHTNGSGLYSRDVTSYTATTITYAFTAMDGGPPIADATVAVTVPLCQLMGYEDALVMGWAIVGAWAMAFGIRFLGGIFRGKGPT